MAHSYLQRLNSRLRWDIGFRLQQYQPAKIVDEILSAHTKDLVRQQNNITRDLKAALIVDYEQCKETRLHCETPVDGSV